MSENEYPPLPSPAWHAWNIGATEDGFCADQMRAYVDADRAKRKPLTKEHLMGLLPKAVRLPSGWLQFARSVEAAHGIHEPKESGNV